MLVVHIFKHDFVQQIPEQLEIALLEQRRDFRAELAAPVAVAEAGLENPAVPALRDREGGGFAGGHKNCFLS